MSLKSRVKKIVNNNRTNKVSIAIKREVEKLKFKNVKRKNIYKKIDLTDNQKEQINSLYEECYGESIPYTWHRHYTAFTGKFDVNYIPELIMIPEFEAFMNINKSYVDVFHDKNILPMLARANNIHTPEVLFTNIEGMIKNDNDDIISLEDELKALSNIGECFIKPSIDTGSGKGCMLLNIKNGMDLESNKKIDEIINEHGSNYVIQKKIICHKSIRNLYSESVNTFRIITYRWKEKILNLPPVMRIGQNGKHLDNAHAGGMFIAIDEDGTLHDKATTEFKDTYEKHPNTGVVFKNYKIDLFPKVLSAAKKLHASIPQLGVCHWDFTIDEYGNPVLIEVNLAEGGWWLPQMAHGKGLFGENTKEVLKWIKIVKKLRKKDRDNYKFGKLR